MGSEMKILFKNLYAKQILVGPAFHTVDATFKNLTFSDSDSLQPPNNELKQFLSSI